MLRITLQQPHAPREERGRSSPPGVRVCRTKHKHASERSRVVHFHPPPVARLAGRRAILFEIFFFLREEPQG